MSGQTSFQVHSCANMNSQTAPVWSSGRDVVLSLCIHLFAVLSVVCPGADNIHRIMPHLNFSRQHLFIFIIWLIPLLLAFNWNRSIIIVSSKHLRDEKYYTWARNKVFLTFPPLLSLYLTVHIFLHLAEAALSFYKISAFIKQMLFLSSTCLILDLDLTLVHLRVLRQQDPQMNLHKHQHGVVDGDKRKRCIRKKECYQNVLLNGTCCLILSRRPLNGLAPYPITVVFLFIHLTYT